MRHRHFQTIFSALICMALVLGFPSSGLTAVAGTGQPPPKPYVPGEVIVKFKPTASAEVRTQVEGSLRAAVKARRQDGATLLRLPETASVEATVRQLQARGDVEFAEPNYLLRATAFDSEPDYEWQWYVQRYDPFLSSAAGKANGSVVVAVLDTGVDLDHPDLAARLLSDGEDFVDLDGVADDLNGHGTHVAGILAAVANNNIGIAGIANNVVAPNVQILPVRVLDETGWGTSWEIASGIRYAADQSNVSIISMSLGGEGPNRTIEDAVGYALQKGKLVIAAAGNEAIDAQRVVPGGVPGVLTVGAHDLNGAKAGFTNYGDTVELYAPGVNIYSTYLNNTYQWMDGTSMATPVVSGVAAILMATGVSGSETYNLIVNSVEPGTRNLHPNKLAEALDPNAVSILQPQPEAQIAGSVTVRVRAPGATSVTLTMTPDGATQPVKTVNMDPTGTDEFTFTATIDPDPSLPAGRYTFTATTDANRKASVQVEILWAAEAGLSLYVTSPVGNPGANAQVRVYRLEESGPVIYAEGTTDEEGDFRVQTATLPDSGQYHVLVVGEFRLSSGQQAAYVYRREFDLSDATSRGHITVDASNAYRVSIRSDVLSPTASEAALWVRDGDGWISAPSFTLEATNGEGVLYLDPGEYGLYVTVGAGAGAQVTGTEFTVSGAQPQVVNLPNQSDLVPVAAGNQEVALRALPAYADVEPTAEVEGYQYYGTLSVPRGEFRFLARQDVSGTTNFFLTEPTSTGSGTATIHVGSPSQLTLEPSNITLEPGGSASIRYRVDDQYGNRLIWPQPSITSDPDWVTPSDPGTLDVDVPVTAPATQQVTVWADSLSATLTVNVDRSQVRTVTVTLQDPLGGTISKTKVDLLRPGDPGWLELEEFEWAYGSAVTVALPDPNEEYWVYVRGTVDDSTHGSYEIHDIARVPATGDTLDVRPSGLVGPLQVSTVSDAVYGPLWGYVLAQVESTRSSYRFTFQTLLTPDQMGDNSVTEAVYVPPGSYLFYTQATDSESQVAFVRQKQVDVDIETSGVISLDPDQVREIRVQGNQVDVWDTGILPAGTNRSWMLPVSRAFVSAGSYDILAWVAEHETEGWWQYFADLGTVDTTDATSPVTLPVGLPAELTVAASTAGREATVTVGLTDTEGNPISLVLATPDPVRADHADAFRTAGGVRAGVASDAEEVMPRLRVQTSTGTVVQDVAGKLGSTSLGTLSPGTYRVTATMSALPTRVLESTTTFTIADTSRDASGGTGGGGGGGSTAPTVPPPEEQETLVGLAGGSVAAFEGEVVLEIPAGAVPDGTTLSIRRVDGVPNVTQPGLSAVSPVFEFTLTDADGNEIEPASGRVVRLKIRYGPSVTEDDARRVAVYREEPDGSGNWVYVGGRLDLESGTIQVDLTGFSRYALLAYRPTFRDLDGHWAKADVELLASRWIVQGADGLFRPDAPITRAELAKLLVTTLRHDVVRAELRAEPLAQPTFSDVAPGAWYYEYVEAAARAGLVTGHEGRFRPADPITREELAAVLVRALGLAQEAQSLSPGDTLNRMDVFTDTHVLPAWARPYVATAAYHGIMRGIGGGRFGAGEPASRAAAAALVRRLADRLGLLEVQLSVTGRLERSVIEGPHYELVTSEGRYVLLVDPADKALAQQLEALVGHTVTAVGLRGAEFSSYQRGPSLRVTAVRGE